MRARLAILFAFAASRAYGQPPPDVERAEPPVEAAPIETTTEPAGSVADADATSEPLPEPPDPPAMPVVEEAPTDEAVSEDEEEEPLVQRINLQIHGFVSQGYMLTLRNDYLDHTRRNGSFEMSEAGINLTVQPIDDLRIGVQLFARDLGPVGDYAIKLDWFYLDYRFTDWLGVRGGRTKIPFGLYNEVNDVDVARVPILLPQSTYPTQNRDFLLSQTGVELYGRIPLSVAGTLEYRLYGGTIFLDAENVPGSPIALVSLDVPYVVGGRLLWETPAQGLRMGGSVQGLRLDTDLLVGGMPVEVNLPAVLWMLSLEYTDGDFLAAAEYARWHVRTNSSDTAIYPESQTVSERAYAMLSYRVTGYFHPGMYYSVFFLDVDARAGRAAKQHDLAATLRFDINPYWLVKLEAHYMHGTAGLSPALNGGTPTSLLPERWAAFYLRTTGYF